MEPFQVKYEASFYSKPIKIVTCQNVKMTEYLKTRRNQGNQLYRARTDGDINAKLSFAETNIGTLDWRPIYLLFQIDDASPLFQQRNRNDDDDENVTVGRYRKVANAFVRQVLSKAAAELEESTKSHRTGLDITKCASRTYRIYERDYKEFARKVTARLENVRLRDLGVKALRLYMCVHGLKVTCIVTSTMS